MRTVALSVLSLLYLHPLGKSFAIKGSQIFVGWIDGWMDGWMDGWTDGRISLNSLAMKGINREQLQRP